MTEVDVLVLGGGAAGLFCAAQAGQRGRRVAVLERSERIGKKILISGGGRCNFTNIHCRAEHFLSENPHFAKSALSRYTPGDFLGLVRRHGIAWHEKTLGQLFCDESAKDIVRMLESECRDGGVTIVLHQQIERVEKRDLFFIRTADGEFSSQSLVIATGGLSIPKMGATGWGYEIARQFGLRVVEPRPALVPLVLDTVEREQWCDLSGVSSEVTASIGKQSFREKMLITHRGLSGPAILQISSYWHAGTPIRIDLAPGANVTQQIRESSGGRELRVLRAALERHMPQRLASRWLKLDPPVAWTNHALSAYEERLHCWTITPTGTEGYEKAEVTAGGVDTAELSAKTLECSRVPGLFFIGEVVDVTGHLGGFNFQWAWASGHAAGQAV